MHKSDTILSDYDMYQLSKYFPGRYGNKQTYSGNSEVAAAMSVKTGISLAKAIAAEDGKIEADIGSTNYTVIMY